MKTETINFRIGTKLKKKFVKWTFTHNLEEYGLALENAFTCWAARTDNPDDINDFREYVISKDPLNLVCNVTV